ncbi:MAG: ABC transporter permease [Nocardioidaceae bacterium]
MNAVAAIVRANLKRLFSDRSNLFFLVVLPLLIVFSLGVAIGGSVGDYKVGVVDPHPTDLSRAVTARLEATANVTVVRVSDAGALRDDVARRTLDGGWVVEPGADAGDLTTFEWFSSGTGDDTQLRTIATSAIEEAGVRDRVVAVVADQTGASTDQAAAAVDAAASASPSTSVTVEEVGEPGNEAASIRAVLAAGELTLFIFLASATGATYLLTTRLLGVTRRVRAAPVPIAQIVTGEAISRFVVAMLQAVIVFFGSMLLFGVDWHDPLAVWLLCVAMSLVGTGVAMLLGTLGRTEQQVSAIGLMLSLVLAALGGSMQPLEFFPDTLRRVAFITPHAWMNDALWKILVEGGGLGQVWVSLLVLTLAGLALLGLASAALAKSLR